MKNDKYEYFWKETLPDPDFDEFWMENLPLFEKEWLEIIREISDNDDIKMLKLLQIFKLYKFYLLYDIEHMNDLYKSLNLLNIKADLDNRKNHTGDFVRKKFSLYAKAHPNKKKMEQINDVANDLGISPKAVEKHIYKK